MISLPGCKMQLWPRVTLTFDLLTLDLWPTDPKVESYTPVLRGTLVPSHITVGSFIIKILSSQFW